MSDHILIIRTLLHRTRDSKISICYPIHVLRKFLTKATSQISCKRSKHCASFFSFQKNSITIILSLHYYSQNRSSHEFSILQMHQEVLTSAQHAASSHQSSHLSSKLYSRIGRVCGKQPFHRLTYVHTATEQFVILTFSVESIPSDLQQICKRMLVPQPKKVRNQSSIPR